MGGFQAQVSFPFPGAVGRLPFAEALAEAREALRPEWIRWAEAAVDIGPYGYGYGYANDDGSGYGYGLDVDCYGDGYVDGSGFGGGDSYSYGLGYAAGNGFGDEA